ncbi:lysozyme family protein [Bacillus thuringiensis]|uniref:lysozyme family protein n=1 Tax=Bacillus thuringiensis TaxID=1428 RepID=UPI000BF9AA74|nr:lysozyme family protein [Bacillus thuringiensis]PFN46150.1 lytic transglycosylase [Bacillus thuringiensis]
MSQNPNDPNEQKKSNPLKDIASHFIKKKGMQARGKMAKLAGKAGKAAAKAAAKMLKAGILKIVGAVVAAVGVPAALVMGVIIAVCVILVSFVPFTDDEDKTEEQVKKYMEVSMALNVDWKEVVAFDMARYDNDLTGKDPHDAISYFLDIQYEEYTEKEVCEVGPNGPCEKKKKEMQKTKSESYSGPDVKKILGDTDFKKKIDEINASGSKKVTTSSHGLEKAMELAKFSKSQKERAREILEAGMLEGMYGHLAPTTGGFIGGMCVGNVSPGGEPVNLNAKVTGYLPKIKEMAEKHGVAQYVGILAAQMMQESGGAGNDPMQASEGHYGDMSPSCVGVKGNARVGCIKDPNISIEAGVQEFKDVLAKANGDIALALQSYNFGSGFISYALAKGGYSEETAIEFSRSKNHLNPAGCSDPNNFRTKVNACYGDFTYVFKVLKYYKDLGCVADVSGEWISDKGWKWPTKSGRITDTFDAVRGGKQHNAVDIGAMTAGKAGDPVWSMEAGIVTNQTGNVNGGGLGVYVDHGNGIVSRYLHLSKISVAPGTMVTKGQIIGEMGGSNFDRDSGFLNMNGYAVHLDFQIRINDQPTDPMKFFKKNDDPGLSSGGSPTMTNAKRQKVLEEAKKWLGQGKVSYVSGARNPAAGSADCSGFTQYVFKTSIGVQLGDWTGAQIGQGKQVPDIGRAQPGDLIFYENPNHVSIYLGNQKMIHIGDNKGVQITGLNYTARGQHMSQIRNVID